MRQIQDCVRLAALDASIMRGLADAEAGRMTPAEKVFDRLERKYGAMKSLAASDDGPAPEFAPAFLTRKD